MSSNQRDTTIPKTEWTNSLLQDLCSALRSNRDNDVVRGFARELMDEKGLPIEYLVRKVEEMVGSPQAERLDILVRGKYLVEKTKAEQARSRGGVFGFVRKLLG